MLISRFRFPTKLYELSCAIHFKRYVKVPQKYKKSLRLEEQHGKVVRYDNRTNNSRGKFSRMPNPKYGWEEKQNRGVRHVGHTNNSWEERARIEKLKRQTQRHPAELTGKAIGLWYKEEQKKKTTQEAELTGKDIGLWYKEKSKKKKKTTQEAELLKVVLPPSIQKELEDSVASVKVPASSVSNNEVPNFHHITDGTFKTCFMEKITSSFEESVEKVVGSKMEQDSTFDDEIYGEYEKKNELKSFKETLDFRQALPAYAKRKEILSAIEQNQIVVISGGTGCGKTTQIPQYILDEFITSRKGSLCNIICTQPRRISAVSVAERIARERCENLGESTGYQIRLEKILPVRNKASLTFATTGVVVQWLQTNPILNGISHLIIDEVHERSIVSDFLITLVKYIITKRPDLKIILMSATINADHFSQYFGGVPHIEIPGMTYPVESYYLEDILEMTSFKFLVDTQENLDKKTTKFFDNYVLPCVESLEKSGKLQKSVIEELKKPKSEILNVNLMAATINHICANEDDGAILVFVPGMKQIKDLHSELLKYNYFASDRVLIIPLHSIMPTIHQKAVFNRPPRGVRKIIIATNIAETSITIDDVVYVVDTGRVRVRNFDLRKDVSTLDSDWVSLANATQRQGRAGRVQPGKCFKLFTRIRENYFEPYPVPEIQRSRLEGVILQAKMLQLGKVAPFLEKVLDPPDPKAVKMSLEVLQNLNALDIQERLTPLGYHLSKLPMDPHTGKMILMGALFSCTDPICSVAASLSFKDPFVYPLGKEMEVNKIKRKFSCGEKSDHLIASKAIQLWEVEEKHGSGYNFAKNNYLSHDNLMLLRDMKVQFAHHLFEMRYLRSGDPKHPASNINSNNKSLVKAIIFAGLYPNVAVIKRSQSSKKNRPVVLKTSNHNRVALHPGSYCSQLRDFPFPVFVYHQMLKSTATYLHDVTMVSPMALLIFGEKLDILEEEEDEFSIVVDNILQFKCSKSVWLLVKKLRNYLNWILEDSFSNPGVTDWLTSGDKKEILEAIVTMLTAEDIIVSGVEEEPLEAS